MVRRASLRSRNQCSFRHSSRNLPLKLSTWAFCIGLPGSMKCRCTPCSQAQRSRTRPANSGPLSTTIVSGRPRVLADRASRSRRCSQTHVGSALGEQPALSSPTNTTGLSRCGSPLTGSAAEVARRTDRPADISLANLPPPAPVAQRPTEVKKRGHHGERAAVHAATIALQVVHQPAVPHLSLSPSGGASGPSGSSLQTPARTVCQPLLRAWLRGRVASSMPFPPH